MESQFAEYQYLLPKNKLQELVTDEIKKTEKTPKGWYTPDRGANPWLMMPPLPLAPNGGAQDKYNVYGIS